MVSAHPIRYADCDGLQVAYQVVGDGPVDLLYVPGHANHIEAMWDMPEMARFTERLGSFSRFILMDKRGTGLSDPLPGDRRATVEERMHDVRAVLDSVGSSSAHLFGTADGTPIAMMAAASHPERVDGLVLYAASARLLEDEGYPGFPDSAVQVFADGFRGTWGSDEDTSSIRFGAPSVADDPRWQRGWARMARRGSTPRAAAEYWALNMRIDVREVLPLIDVPTLVIQCRGDRLYPPAQGRHVAEHIPGAKLVELEGTDHFFFAEHGERVADEIEEFVTGQRPGALTHRRLATVLFTDVVGSTERDVELGDRRWRALLDAHDEMVAVQVERRRGRVVKSTGDGCMALFDGPQAAISAADGIRRGSGALGLDVRAGLHTGEVEHRGDDLAGVAVHLAARVAGLADTGEILVTRTVRDLVVGSDLEFADRGTHDLKGLDEPWQLYAVVTPED